MDTEDREFISAGMKKRRSSVGGLKFLPLPLNVSTDASENACIAGLSRFITNWKSRKS
jgi:hypothetical protein